MDNDRRRLGGTQGDLEPIRPSELVDLVLASLRAKAALLPQTLSDREVVLRLFAGYAENGLGAPNANEISPADAQGFVQAIRADGSAPSDSARYRRRAAVRLLYAEGRSIGLVNIDPARDIWLPPRSSLRTRALTDDEIELGRSWAMNSLTSLRRPLAWAISEAGGWTSEVTATCIGDVDLANLRVWLHGNPTKDPRWGSLTEWGAVLVERRLREGDQLAPSDPLLVWRRRPRSGHAAASQAIKETLRAAGLDREPDVRPRSLVAWKGRRLLDEGRGIVEVALALGYRGLDEAAEFVRFAWRQEVER